MKKKPLNVQVGELVRLLQTNQIQEARALGIRLARMSPNNAQVLSILGATHGRLGEFREAESCYQALVAIEPWSFQHHCYLGLSLVMQRRLEEAIKPFSTMLQLRPDFAEGHMQMGCLLRDLGHLDPAIDHLRQAIRLAPALVDAVVFLANILVYRGEIGEALNLCDLALAKRPDHPEVLASRALVLEKQGRRDDAWQCITATVTGNAVTPNAAIIYAKLSPKYGYAERGKALLNEMLSRSSLAPSQRQEMHFALAELSDKTAEYDTAFSHYRAANALSPHRIDVDRTRKKAESLIEVTSRTNLPAVRETPQNAPTPIFIVGMPRSGTSLVEQILASHPDVAAAGELEVLNDVEHRASSLMGRPEPYPECLSSASVSELAALARPYLDAITSISAGAQFVTDKLPGNYERLGLIEKLFPNARIIHTIRHPLDTCLSCYFQNFGNTHTYSSNLRALGEVYRIYEKLMAHWHATLSIGILDVHYETLVNSPETEVRRLLKFCQLPWEPRCLEFYNSGRYVNTASYDQVRQPIYQTSVGRWKHYESHLDELIDALS
ncbi:MAG: tetratricopeptide repeat-containing sulfotransferase family protein [Acidiferrobacterales bacterium]